jgi:heme-degrading monooxygenase HmoA
MKPALFALSAVAMSACTVSQPFEGPGYKDGKVTSNHDGDFIAVVGALVVKDDQGSKELFDKRSQAIQESLNDNKGLVGASFSLTLGSPEYKVLTVWETEEDMYEFVTTDEHAKAMDDGPEMASGGRVVYWSVQRENVPPTWDDANAKLDADGEEIQFE